MTDFWSHFIAFMAGWTLLALWTSERLALRDRCLTDLERAMIREAWANARKRKRLL